MDVASDASWLNLDAQLLVEVLDETVDKMDRAPVGFLDERVVALDDAHVRVLGIERCQVRIILPKLRMHRVDICEKSSWITPMQVTHSSCEHDDIAWRL